MVEAESLNSAGDDHLAHIGAVAAFSEHPLSRAIYDYARQKGIHGKSVTGFQSVPGKGVCGVVEAKKIFIGNAEWLKTQGMSVEIAETLEKSASQQRKLGRTVLFALVDGVPDFRFLVSDSLKSGAVEAVGRLKKMGIEVVMASGDHSQSAQAVARQVGIDIVHAPVTPVEKAELVKTWQSKGKKVLMVGDGVNDAVAITQADVGMAMGNGTDIALESAEVALVKGSISGVVTAVLIGRSAIKNIKENLFFAFFY
ncbi:MAG: HAD-IC family P-type ATPase, partial [Verrucomicrobiales bacterium]